MRAICALWGLACLFSLAVQASPEVEVNVANQAELEQVSGLGPQLSMRILAERQRAGPFANWQDLMGRLKGVGPASARKLSHAGLRVQGEDYAAASSPNVLSPTMPLRP